MCVYRHWLTHIRFDWWGNRWQIALSILMDDIIWLMCWSCVEELRLLAPLTSPSIDLSLFFELVLFRLPLNPKHGEGCLSDPCLCPSASAHTIHLYLRGIRRDWFTLESALVALDTLPFSLKYPSFPWMWFKPCCAYILFIIALFQGMLRCLFWY